MCIRDSAIGGPGAFTTLTTTQTISGNKTFSGTVTLPTLASLTTSGNATIGGDLTVNGTTTTINSTTVAIDDKNFQVATGSANDTAADGGGIILKGSPSDHTFTWSNATDSWQSSEDMELDNGKTYNINADTAAGAIASSLKSKRLLILTDVKGVLDSNQNLIEEVNEEKIEKMIESGEISGGMIPKINTCLKSVKEGVGAAAIVDGRVKHAVLLELFTDHGAGTLIR